MVISAAVDALLGTFTIFFSFVVLAVTFTGLGLSLRRAFLAAKPTIDDCFLAFWLGFGLVILFLLLWNFILPVGQTPFVIVLVAGVGGMFAARQSLNLNMREWRPRRWLTVAAASLFGVWVANLSLGRLTSYDSTLYHIQGVEWAKAYSVVPGLANLYGPLGFNNSTFLYNAMLDALLSLEFGGHLSNGLLVAVFGAQIIMSAEHLAAKRAAKSSLHVFLLCVFPYAVFLALKDNVTGFGTHAPASLLILLVAAQTYQVLACGERPDEKRAYDCFGIVFLAAIAVTVKSSVAVFAAAVVPLLWYEVFHAGRMRRGLRKRATLWSLTAVALVCIAWVARGVILSGYPLFPNPVFGFPVEWKVPVEHARAEFDFVVHSARATASELRYVSGEARGLGMWFLHWARITFYQPYEVFVPAGLAAIAGGSLLVPSRRTSLEGRLPKAGRGWLLLGPLGLALVAWWAVAPMPHYGGSFFWAVAAVVGSQALRLRCRTGIASRNSVVALLALGVTPCLVVPVWPSEKNPSLAPGVVIGRLVEVDRLLGANFRFPDPGHWYQVDTPAPPTSSYRTETGLTLNVPAADRCWDAPLPCTPNPAPNLSLRFPGRMDRGFRVDGEWQMLNWPYSYWSGLLEAMRERWRKGD